MKKIIYSLLISSLLLSGCGNFLEEEDKAGITNSELYATESGYQTLRVNAYNSLRLIYDESPMALLAGTDLYQMPRGVVNNGIYDYVTLYDTNEDIETFYRECYQVLQAVNTAEYYLPGAAISYTDRGLYQAEYDFLKGFVHFLLLEQFGGIVINDTYTQSPVTSMPRSSREESYEYIIRKLTAALASSDLPQTAQDGHICKDMVNHYLSKVYLTRGWDTDNQADFALAKQYASAVISARGALRYSMEDLWKPTNENNEEVIFAIQYSSQSIASPTEGNNQEALFGPYMGGTEAGHKYMATELYPSWSLHSWFDANDARYEATFMLTIWEHYYDYYQGRNVPGTNLITTIYPRVWNPNQAQEMFEEYCRLTRTDNPESGVFNDVTLTNEDGSLVNGALDFIQKWCPQYADVVPRNATSVTSNGTRNIMRIYPFISNFSDPQTNESYWRSGYNTDFCQPPIKKFDLGELVQFDPRQSYRDIVLATLSETMLLYAEACIGEENYQEAETYINQVLARPGNSKNGIPLTVSLPTNREEALEVYLKESGKELAGQYCGRWPELRRTGMLKQMFYKYNYDYLTGNLGADPIGDKLYRPIPQAAIETNDALSDEDQNPGY